jgi:hypothetical protein
VLIEETTAAIAAAESTAASCKEKAFDLALGHDEAKAAHDKMVDASFRADRLKTLPPRLRVRWGEALRREEADAWRRERDQFESTRCPEIAAARASYEAALQAILGFFAQIADFTAARGNLLSKRPHHLGLENVAELPIPAATKMLADTRLFDLENGAQLWPNPQQINALAVAMSTSVHAMMSARDRDEYTPFWWRASQRRQAAAAAEGARRDENLARIASEERERYLRDLAHGAR